MFKIRKHTLGTNLQNLGKKIIGTFLIFSFFIPVHATYINDINTTIRGGVMIQNDATFTQNLNVTINLNVSGATQMRFGNTITQRDAASWETYSTTKPWTLPTGEGKKTVYVSLKNSSGGIIHLQDDIIYKSNPSLPYNNNLTLWFDASDAGSIIENTGNISIWNDKSGNNFDAVQGSVNNQPNYINDANQTSNIVDFNGSSDYLAVENYRLNGSNRLDGMLVCASFKVPYVNGANQNWAFLDYDRSEFFNFYSYRDGVGFSFNAGGIKDNYAIGGGYSTNSWNISCARYDNSIINDTLIKVNGNIEVNKDNTTNGTQIGSILTRYGFIGDGSEALWFNGTRNNIYYDGGIGEILYYDASVPDTDIQNIECYLGKKWGVTVNGCTETIEPIASVSYFPKTATPNNVTATLGNFSEDVTITNNGGSGTYLFTQNGSFTFEYVDANGNTGSTTATVHWIDENVVLPGANQAPTITSFSGQSTVSVDIVSGSTNVATISATDTSENVIGQFGTATLSENSWVQIPHEEMCTPVVVVSHRGNVNGEPQRVPRVKNKLGTSFFTKVDNYNQSLTGMATNIDYVVINSGRHTVGGINLEAGSQSVSKTVCNASNGGGGETVVNFNPAFTSNPAVIHTISSDNDSSWTVSAVNGNDGTRQSEPSTTKMGLALQRSFASCSHQAETIDYMAFEPGHGTFGSSQLDAVVSSDSIRSVTASGSPITFSSAFPAAPKTVLVSQMGEDGGNGGYGQIHSNGGVNATTVFATTDEDGPGADRGHTTEVFSAVAFSDDSGTITEPNTITYSINGGIDASHFTIDGISGALSFLAAKNPATPDDANTDGIYEVTVQACDSHCNSKCSSQTILADIGVDTTNPVISSTNFSDNTILPGGNHSIEIQYSDTESGINTSSATITLQKWDATNSIWGANIAGTSIINPSVTATTANYKTSNLSYGKYKYNFSIQDVVGNTSTVEVIFYIDKPTMTISSKEVDIGSLSHVNPNYGQVTITVQTVGAGFDVTLNKNQTLQNSFDTIQYYDGTKGFGFDKNDDGQLVDIGTNEVIMSETKNINTDGELQTYTKTISLGALIKTSQMAGNYEGFVDIGIDLNY